MCLHEYLWNNFKQFLRLSALTGLSLCDSDEPISFRCLLRIVLSYHWCFLSYLALILTSIMGYFTGKHSSHFFLHSYPCYQVHAVLEEILEKLPEEFNMAELLGKAEERTPYQVVALQECERMNILTQEIRCSLHELSLGLKVSSGFEVLMGGYALLWDWRWKCFALQKHLHCTCPVDKAWVLLWYSIQ